MQLIKITNINSPSKKWGIISKIFLVFLVVINIAFTSINDNTNSNRTQNNYLLEIIAPTPLSYHLDKKGKIQIKAKGENSLVNCSSYLVSRVQGQKTWSEEYSTFRSFSQSRNKLTLIASFSSCTATIIFEKTKDGRIEITGNLKATGSVPIEIARFHYLDGYISNPKLNLLSMRQYELPGRIFKPNENLKSPRATCEKNWGGVIWPRLSEPIHDRENTAISGDVGMLAPDWNSEGFFWGVTGPGSAFGEFGIKTAQNITPFFAAILLDAITLNPGKTRILENSILSFGDPQDELRNWILLCKKVLDPARISPPLVGYCSWYQKGQGVKPDDILYAINSFKDFETPPGGKTIQIDDGFQVCPGDWSGRDEWESQLDSFPFKIAQEGFIPGIWIAPTAIHETHPIVRNHPEWLQRDENGQFCIQFHNWRNFKGMTTAKTYFLDSDHPEARKFIFSELRKLREKGWKYFKIDFAYTVSSSRSKYDSSKTTYETLRDQWILFREALGDSAIINSCNGGIWRYTIGVVDISRAGGDIGTNIKSLRRNISEMMLRSHVNGVWFQVDPDVYFMRTVKSNLNFEQAKLLVNTQGLLGSTFLTSDYSEQWTHEAVDIVKKFWNQRGPQTPKMLHIDFSEEGLPLAMSIALDPGKFVVAIYNWDNKKSNTTINLDKLRLPKNQRFKLTPINKNDTEILLKSNSLSIFNQPSESLRYVQLESI